jgi:hypothetical protein
MWFRIPSKLSAKVSITSVNLCRETECTVGIWQAHSSDVLPSIISFVEEIVDKLFHFKRPDNILTIWFVAATLKRSFPCFGHLECGFQSESNFRTYRN